MREELAQMRTDLGLVFKNITRGAKKVNVVNYMTKPPPPTDEYYYEEDTYVVNVQCEIFDQTPNDPIRKIGAKVMETKIGTIVTAT